MYRRIFSITSATVDTWPGKAFYGSEAGLPDYFAVRTERTKADLSDNFMAGHSVNISWQTKSEINTSYFELQRSENGMDFHSIEMFGAAGDSKKISRYSTTDRKIIYCSDKLYYRLRLVFRNGKQNFTEAILLDLNSVAANSVYDLTYNRNEQ